MVLRDILHSLGRKVFFFGLLLLALFCIANGVVYLGVGQRILQQKVGDPLGLTLTAKRITLASTLHLIARDVRGTRTPNDTATATLSAETILFRGRDCLLEHAHFVLDDSDGGRLFPACFESARADILRTASKPCPARILSPLAAALAPSFDSLVLTNASFVLQSTASTPPRTTPIFLGLDYGRRLLGEFSGRASIDFSFATYRVFGPAQDPDGRPNDGSPGHLEWRGGSTGIPIKIISFRDCETCPQSDP